MAQTGRVRIWVMDATGASVPGAVGWLGTEDKLKKTANEAGEIVFTNLPFGDCRFTIAMPGFKNRELTVTIRNGDEVNVEAVLDVGSVGGVVIVETAPVKLKR